MVRHRQTRGNAVWGTATGSVWKITKLINRNCPDVSTAGKFGAGESVPQRDNVQSPSIWAKDDLIGLAKNALAFLGCHALYQ